MSSRPSVMLPGGRVHPIDSNSILSAVNAVAEARRQQEVDELARRLGVIMHRIWGC